MSARTNDVRKEVLMQLAAVRPVPVSSARVTRDARKAGYDYSQHEVEAELDFLASAGMAEEVDNSLGSERLYKITAAGVKQYERGLD